jgi:hypothetical protein
MNFKFERKKTLKDTLKFNLVLGFILTLLAPLISYIQLKLIDEIYLNIVLFLSIVGFSLFEYSTRKKIQLNKVVFTIYLIIIAIASLFFIYQMFLVIVGLLPWRWG